MIETIRNGLESNIQMNFNKFDEENDKKKADFDVSCFVRSCFYYFC